MEKAHHILIYGCTEPGNKNNVWLVSVTAYIRLSNIAPLIHSVTHRCGSRIGVNFGGGSESPTLPSLREPHETVSVLNGYHPVQRL